MPGKDSLAMLALGRIKPGPRTDAAEEGAESDGAEGLEMAMQDLLSAIDAKDTGAMADAFKSASAMVDND